MYYFVVLLRPLTYTITDFELMPDVSFSLCYKYPKTRRPCEYYRRPMCDQWHGIGGLRIVTRDATLNILRASKPAILGSRGPVEWDEFKYRTSAQWATKGQTHRLAQRRAV